MSTATVGARYQIVIPVKERKKIHIQPNQKVNIFVEDDRIILEPIGYKPIRGLTKELRDSADPVEYVNKLRQEWKNRT